MKSEFEKITNSLSQINKLIQLNDVYFEVFFCHYHDEEHIPTTDFHSHPFFELHVMLDGKCQQDYEKKLHSRHEKDEFWLIYPEIIHSRAKNLLPKYREIIIAFNLYKIVNNKKNHIFPPLKTQKISKGYVTHSIANIINKILLLAIKGDENSINKINLQIYLLILEFLDLIFEKNNALLHNSTNLSDKRLKNICIFISDNLQHKLTAEDIANTYKISVRQLDRIFMKNFEVTIAQYIKQEKYNLGRKMLELTDLSIDNIAYRVGFDSSFSFRRFFASFAGINPTEYRKNFILNSKTSKIYKISGKN